MRKLLRKIFITACCFFCWYSIAAQYLPFQQEIDTFKKKDSVKFPPKHSIVFTGSSSIRAWPEVQKYFPGHSIINRGFGGATIPDLIKYSRDVIFPYEPKQVLIYCGENDLVDTLTVKPDTILHRMKKLIELIRSSLPDVNILYVSIKPSPGKFYLQRQILQTNALVKSYIESIPNAAFINIYNSMVDQQGNPRKDLFMDDLLHMKPEGYKLWQVIIRPYLK